MPHIRRALPACVTAAILLATAALGSCSSDDGSTSDAADVTSSDSTVEPSDTAAASDDVVSSLFDEGALTSDSAIVSCTLENGSETACYELEVASLSSVVDTDGPYCPDTVDDVGGIWVWDGDEPGLYALDGDFWALVESQGFEFVEDDGNITVADPAAGGADTGGTANSCLEATPDGSFHLRVLIPTEPELLDEPSDLSTVSQVGLALDGVTIFGDAPSVADRGGLPALDACGGHIDPSGYYHWHFGAESIQSNLDDADIDLTCDVTQDVESVVALAFDGHPIYGPEEGGSAPTDLDECSGHVSDTDEFGETYHYHLSSESPNLPACLVGATVVGTLSSPDNANASLPGGAGAGAPGGGPDGPPPGAGG